MTNHILSIFEYFHLYVIASPEDFWDVINIFYLSKLLMWAHADQNFSQFCRKR